MTSKANQPNEATTVEIVDIEEFARRGEKPPKAKRYKIRIDKQHYEVAQPSITGRELLRLAGKEPVERFKVFQKLHGQEPKQVGLDEHVDLTAPGIERFITLPCDLQEGLGRRDFNLPRADETFLNSSSFTWETIRDGGHQWLVIQGFKLPKGYNIETVTLGLIIPPAYPTTEIDMAYFAPSLARADGKAIPSLAPMVGAGRNWQRWSRHRKPGAQWRAGEDSIETHLCLVQAWLDAELRR